MNYLEVARVNLINNLLDRAIQTKDHKTIVLVANVDGRTKAFSDYSADSVVSEYLSELEVEELINGFHDFGFATYVYYDETDFINEIVNYSRFSNYSSLIVVNLAQKGTSIGRKSLIPAFCQLYRLRYVSSNPYVVSLCRDKYVTGAVLNQHELRTPKSWLYSKNGWLQGRKPANGSKIIIKLNHESASIGMDGSNILYYHEEKEVYLRHKAIEYNQDLIIQEFIAGFEVEVPFIRREQIDFLIPVGITLSDDPFLDDKILTYEIRGTDAYSFYDYSTFRPHVASNLLKAAKQTAELLNIQGIGRIDFRVDFTGCWFITDIATNPHIVNHSSFHFAFREKGYTYPQMLAVIAGLAAYDSDQN
jgi:D-alanine-D-alanine ligase